MAEPVPATPEPEQEELNLSDEIDYELEILTMSLDYANGQLLQDIKEEIKVLTDSKEFVG